MHTGGTYKMINSRAFSHLKNRITICLACNGHCNRMTNGIGKMLFFYFVHFNFQPNYDVQCRFVWKYEIKLLFISYAITIHDLICSCFMRVKANDTHMFGGCIIYNIIFHSYHHPLCMRCTICECEPKILFTHFSAEYLFSSQRNIGNIALYIHIYISIISID